MVSCCLKFEVATWTRKDGFQVTTDPKRVDLEALHRYLAERSYWMLGVPRCIVQRSVENSVPFSVLDPSGRFVGFARMVTDLATFGYLEDVFILEEHQRKGLSKFLMSKIMEFPEFQTFRRWCLFTKDAHDLYRQFGWTPLVYPERGMEIKKETKQLYSKL